MTAAEEWRPVVGWEKLYEVSSLGRVRSLTRNYFDAIGRWRVFKGKVIDGTQAHDGYRQVVLSRKDVDRQIYLVRFVHRLVLEAFRGPCPEHHVTCHGNGVPWDNRLDNLRWGTQKENDDDKLRHGTYYRRWMCDKPRQSKARTVEQIRAIRETDAPIPLVAAQYEVPKQMVYRIRTRRSWASLV